MAPVEPRHALIYACVGLFGLLQVLLARWLVGQSRDLLRRGKRAPGRVVRRARHEVVEFTAEDGRTGAVTSRIGAPWSPLAKRPNLTVIHDPDDLEHAVIDAWLELWAAPTLFLANGGLMLLAALVLAALQTAGVFVL